MEYGIKSVDIKYNQSRISSLLFGKRGEPGFAKELAKYKLIFIIISSTRSTKIKVRYNVRGLHSRIHDCRGLSQDSSDFHSGAQVQSKHLAVVRQVQRQCQS